MARYGRVFRGIVLYRYERFAANTCSSPLPCGKDSAGLSGEHEARAVDPSRSTLGLRAEAEIAVVQESMNLPPCDSHKYRS